jgi:hypothetical protein
MYTLEECCKALRVGVIGYACSIVRNDEKSLRAHSGNLVSHDRPINADGIRL